MNKLSNKILFVIIFIIIISVSEGILLIKIIPEANTIKNNTIFILTGIISFIIPTLLIQIGLYICVKKIEKLNKR